MLAANLAVVHTVLPERHGVLVTYRSGVSFTQSDTGDRFVRVLAPRAHAVGGSSVSLPEIGELGVVLDIDEEISVWIGSLHWMLGNQAEPSEDLWSWRHQSGVSMQVRGRGDMQLDHPSGLRVRFASEDAPLPEVKNSTSPGAIIQDVVFVEVYHPSGAYLTISEIGEVNLFSPENIAIQTDKDLSVKVTGNMTSDVTGNLTSTVAGNATSTVSGDLSASVTGKATVSVGGDLSASVSGAVDATVGGALNVTASGEATIKAPKIHLKA